jgi:hypothetical protein
MPFESTGRIARAIFTTFVGVSTPLVFWSGRFQVPSAQMMSRRMPSP